MSYAENRKAYHDFEILEKFEAGLSLFGHEVKAIMTGKGSLKGARVIIRNEEAFLVSAHVAPYQEANVPDDYEPDRPRKLLLHKRELQYLSGKAEVKGLTIIPLKLYSKSRKVKLEFAIVRGKKQYDKRATIAEKDAKRRIERTFKNR